MEEDQKLKHVCKLCNKSFPCGRSLGGHMRSHVINSAQQTVEKLNKKKHSSAHNGGSNANANTDTGIQEGGTHTVYGLRENPKKTCRFADSSEDTLLHTKLCKDCGKSFQSWKALFGHMKCHSGRLSNSLEEESWTSATEKPVMDNQSDNEVAVPSRRKRSSRRVASRYTTTTTSSSVSIANASSSASEIEQEQEEVAMCLMMLSRDVGHWSGLNSVVEFSDNNSEFLDARSSIQTNGVAGIVGKINSLCDGGQTVKLKRHVDGKSESSILDSENSQFDEKQSEIGASGFSRNGLQINKLEAAVKNGLLPNDKFEVELKKNLVNENGFDKAELGSKKQGSSKRKCRQLFDPKLGLISSSKLICGSGFDTEMRKGSEKRNRFECTACNKTFHSYQALGGHRASHKKLKLCSASKIDSSETSIKTEALPDPSANTKLIEAFSNEDFNDHESKKSKGHECPVCLKVFSSGQALGGHKRSHMSGGTEPRSNQSMDIQRPIPEIRDLLDLNLPAPAEEESNGNVGFKPWWVGSNSKHDPLVSLLSN